MVLNIVLNVLGTISFKYSALRQNEAPANAATIFTFSKPALLWFGLANLLGFFGTVAFAKLLRYLPLSLAFTITGALTFLSVNIFGAMMLFHETVTPVQWGGVAFLLIGLAMISTGIKA